MFFLISGSDVYIKLCEALNNSFLLRGIKQASPVQQTSCLEGYHSVVNQFAPKMLAFSYLGILSRYFKWNTLLRKINHKAKNVCFTDASYFHSKLVSMFACIFRTILATLHFNWNLNRDQQKDSQGKTKLCVTYPKFKEGEGTVRECRVKQNYGMTNFFLCNHFGVTKGRDSTLFKMECTVFCQCQSQWTGIVHNSYEIKITVWK